LHYGSPHNETANSTTHLWTASLSLFSDFALVKTRTGSGVTGMYIRITNRSYSTGSHNVIIVLVTFWGTTILGYCTNLNFTYLIQLLTMSLRCFLCFLHELFAIYNEKCQFALSISAILLQRRTKQQQWRLTKCVSTSRNVT